MYAKVHFRLTHLETQLIIYLTLFLGMMIMALKAILKILKENKVICSDSFKLKNNIDFEIKNLSLELKRKEIKQYNPLFYIFGCKLKSKPWQTLEEYYGLV